MTDEIPEPTRSAWEGLPEQIAKRLVQLRQLVLEVARENPAIGPLEETVKWGEPAFLTAASGSGTTVRIHRHKKSPDTYALYVHCQTDLVERYRQLYGEELTFDGNRAVLFDSKEELPTEAVRHCIAMALTYHLQKRS
ncbi:DUF1801 domain-containing protein [Sphingopyxis sp. BSNA05]|uniref:DUF1801 domain-containing protein n=1 Tax=Sphingomonadales TaxID=204457 RepID=UPI000C1EAFC7|nr:MULTISPECIES: DUF1801 domain-containing protein [Sphingomonadaceae]ATW02970.1 hypothetical protein CHN51_05040 [Sphingorhabdus sp. YGSMI21]NRD88250.1 DUF1801 domain-containing protein [Sphingopyxis sp. BSNA05]